MSMRFTLSIVEDRPPSLQGSSSPIAQRCRSANGLVPTDGAPDSWGRQLQQNPHQGSSQNSVDQSSAHQADLSMAVGPAGLPVQGKPTSYLGLPCSLAWARQI